MAVESTPTAGPAPVDPTTQIDENMRRIQDFQNRSQASMTMWQALMSVDEKGWKVLEGVINDVKS